MSRDKNHMCDEMLAKHGLRKTAFRKEVLTVFLAHQGTAITNEHIEEKLGEYDRITLYRTLKSFEDKGLIHQAMDNSGQSKYALCSHNCDAEAHHDMHAHFHCEQCGKTLCLEDMPRPINQLVPDGYQVKDVQITFNGKCSLCN